MSEAIVELTARAYEIARAIPPGRVTSYGQSYNFCGCVELTGRPHCQAGGLSSVLEVRLLSSDLSLPLHPNWHCRSYAVEEPSSQQTRWKRDESAVAELQCAVAGELIRADF